LKGFSIKLPFLEVYLLKNNYFCRRYKESNMNEIHTVSVFCASSSKINPKYVDAATRLGELFAEKNICLLNGGGKFGLMSVMTDAVVDRGGEAVGVIPQFMVDHHWDYDKMTRMIVVRDMHERKQTMANMSDAVIALPGGCGTWDELIEIITWKQLGLYLNPIVILNIDGYYDPLLQMFQKAIDEHFMRVLHADLWNVATTPEEAVDLIFQLPLWNSNFSKFAAI
jgi:uncharacterized protein (TIGR00730 family)